MLPMLPLMFIRSILDPTTSSQSRIHAGLGQDIPLKHKPSREGHEHPQDFIHHYFPIFSNPTPLGFGSPQQSTRTKYRNFME
jgi:hypothetical protein